MLYFLSQHKIVSNDTLEADVKVPAALNLPFGQLFFGFNVAAYTPSEPVPGSPESTPQVICSKSSLRRVVMLILYRLIVTSCLLGIWQHS
jgi:hypothetical protein